MISKPCHDAICTHFRQWMQYGKSVAVDLNENVLTNLYGPPMIATLSHVFAAGWMYGHDKNLEGCWNAYFEVQKTHPDLFRGYAYAHEERCLSNLRKLFVLGYLAKEIPPSDPAPEQKGG